MGKEGGVFPPLIAVREQTEGNWCFLLPFLEGRAVAGTAMARDGTGQEQRQGQHAQDSFLLTNIISELIHSRLTNQLHTCQPSQVFISVCFTVWVLGVCDLCICLLFIKKDSFKPTYSEAIR